MAVGNKAKPAPGRRKNRRTDPWLYTINRALAPIVPIELANAVSTPIADLCWLLWKSKREKAQRNYARILGRAADDPLVAKLAHSSFRHFGRYIVELMHVQGWSVDRLQEAVEIIGGEHFEEALAHGRGVIFTSAHMGSIEIASALLLLNGYKVTSVMERLSPKPIMDYIIACREKAGISLLPVQGTGMRLVRALRRNEMVALVLDLGVANDLGVPVRFFGQQTTFPVGPARLARISRAPLIFGLALRKPGNRYLAYISPPIFANREMEPGADAQATTQRLVDEFERFARRYPDQWYAFRDMFPDDSWPGR